MSASTNDVHNWLMKRAARVDYSGGRVYIYWGDESESDGMTCAVGLTLEEAVEHAAENEGDRRST